MQELKLEVLDQVIIFIKQKDQTRMEMFTLMSKKMLNTVSATNQVVEKLKQMVQET